MQTVTNPGIKRASGTETDFPEFLGTGTPSLFPPFMLKTGEATGSGRGISSGADTGRRPSDERADGRGSRLLDFCRTESQVVDLDRNGQEASMRHRRRCNRHFEKVLIQSLEHKPVKESSTHTSFQRTFSSPVLFGIKQIKLGSDVDKY